MRERDARQLLELVRQDFPETSTTPPAIWDDDPAVKVIDCVLSLNRRYEREVVPRVTAFAASYPGIKTCVSLRDAMLAATPEAFLRTHLDMRDPRRAATPLGVAEFALDAAHPFPAESEEASLRAWAADARPGDSLAVGVRGFGLAGFQPGRLA